MDWPNITNVLKIKPVTDEKSQKRLWTVYKKSKKKRNKQKKEKPSNEGNHRIDIYA
ncbi:hypothetical protein [Persephonella sp. IF05-L8]|uniref:hypothetical protein n=1 Tax=Persephonella sp. IF05-L8 TaxID=1158338 RepID=UPI0012DC7A00